MKVIFYHMIENPSLIINNGFGFKNLGWYEEDGLKYDVFVAYNCKGNMREPVLEFSSTFSENQCLIKDMVGEPNSKVFKEFLRTYAPITLNVTPNLIDGLVKQFYRQRDWAWYAVEGEKVSPFIDMASLAK